jgi:molybdopterin synthase catalytic subunit
VRSWITRDAIDVAALLPLVGAAEDGALLVFVGVVRDHNDGRQVSGMRYDAYVEMAEHVLADIAREASVRLGTDRVVVVHRIGDLRVGDASVATVVSSAHRAEAYDASRYIIEEIKKRLPVWKQEHYMEGTARWLDGHAPQPEPAHE